MNGALYTAKTGLEAQNLKLQYISNNLSNAETNGFKATRPEFAALTNINLRAPSSAAGSAAGGLQVGTGVQVIGDTTDFTQGQSIETGRALDIMIDGDGYIPVLKDDGTRLYTRGGSFTANGEGTLVTNENYTIDPEITIPENTTSINIAADGTVTVQLSGNDELTELGQLEIVKFINQNGLMPLSGGYFEKLVDTSGDEITGIASENGFGEFRQGYLESSNVDTVTELVNMISTQRAYEMSSKMMNAASEMMKTLNNNV